MRWTGLVGVAFGAVLFVTRCGSNDGTCPTTINGSTACSRNGLVCPNPGTECGSCVCNGSAFACTLGNCFDGGGTPTTCPAPTNVFVDQPCTNGLTCASSGYACSAGSSAVCACTIGKWACSCVTTPTVIAAGENALSIAVDDTSVYWIAFDVGAIRRARKANDGGAPETLASGQSFASVLVLDAANVYWTNEDNPGGSVMTIPKGGGAPVALVQNEALPSSIAVDATNVYWGALGAVRTAPIGGGSATTLVALSARVNGIAASATTVYCATDDGLIAAPIAGGSEVMLSPGFANDVALDANNVYWTTFSDVMQMSIATPSTVTIASSNHDQPSGLAVDGTSVYWANGTAVMKAPIGGGPPVVVAFVAALVRPEGIAVDSQNVYFATYDSHVMSAPK